MLINLEIRYTLMSQKIKLSLRMDFKYYKNYNKFKLIG